MKDTDHPICHPRVYLAIEQVPNGAKVTHDRMLKMAAECSGPIRVR